MTQAYNAFPTSDPPDTNDSNGSPTQGGTNEQAIRDRTVSSPVLEDDAEDDESQSPDLPNGHFKPSSSSQSSDDETSVIPAPAIHTPLPRHRTSSLPQSSFPSLSSLPKDLLRIGRSALPSAMFTSSQPVPLPRAVESEDSGSSSSEDENIPVGLKGRFASGSQKKKVKTGGVMGGW